MGKTMSYIGVDMGTSGCKAAVLESDGTIVASASRDYPFVIPRPGWAELDPVAIRRAVLDVLAELAPAARQATALAVATIGESMVMTDADDRILYNAITYADGRSEDTIPVIEAAIPARRMHEISGMPMNQMYTLNKLLWFRENRPDILGATRKIFLINDYLGYVLTGKRMVDAATVARTMMLDLASRDWSDEILKTFGIDRELFSPVVPVGTRVGTILPSIAGETGLPRGLEVVQGAHDQVCASLGSGTFRAGDIMVGEGSTESLNLVIARDGETKSLIDNKVSIGPFLEGKYFAAAAQLTHGTSIRWFVEIFREKIELSRSDPKESLYALADRMCAGDSGGVYFLPYLAGVDPNDGDNTAKGCFVGLDVTIDMWRMYRAVLEGLSFETRLRLELLTRSGAKLGDITAAGGAAKSTFLMQMKADVLERPIRVLKGGEACVSALGMICAVANGDCPDYASAVERFVRIERTLHPQTNYTERYRGYKAVHNHMRALFRELR